MRRRIAGTLLICLCVAGLPALAIGQNGSQSTHEEPNETVPALGVVNVRGQFPRQLESITAKRALTPGGVGVVNGQAFYNRSVNNLADALRYVPGVLAQSKAGGGELFISIRGSNLDATDYDNNGVRLFQDGLPITTADGNNHNRFIDPFTARYITVARGANALAYGASTLGGAINIVSRTARNSEPFQLFVHGGSHGLRDVRLSAGGVSGDLDGLITLGRKLWNGYRAHSRQDRTSLSGNVGWRIADDFNLRFFATHIDSDQQLAGGLTRARFDANPRQANPAALSGNYQKNVETDRVAAKGVWDINSDSHLQFGLSYEKESLYHPIVDKVMVDFDGPGPKPPVEVFSLLIDTDQRTLGGMACYHFKLGAHDLLAGINAGITTEKGGHYRNDGGRRNGLSEDVDNRSDNTALFVVDRWTLLPDWILTYGAQGVITGRDVRITDVESGRLTHLRNQYTSFNPRVGVIHKFNDSGEIFASVSGVYEAPTTFELRNDVAGGDHTLDAMHGTAWEIGLRGASTAPSNGMRLRWNVSAYYARIHDEILSVEDPKHPGTSLSTNIDSTVHAGLEARLRASFALGDGAYRIEPLVSMTINRFSFDGDLTYGDNTLPAAPTYALHGEVMYRNADGFYAGPTFDVLGSRYGDFANTYRVDGYALMGLRAGFEQGEWNVFIEARNLFDQNYVGSMSVRNRAGAQAAILRPGAPRSVYVGFRIRL